MSLKDKLIEQVEDILRWEVMFCTDNSWWKVFNNIEVKIRGNVWNIISLEVRHKVENQIQEKIKES
jgi:hypothetical protein